MATRGGDIDFAHVLDSDRHQSLRLERLEPWAAAAAGKREGCEEGRGTEGCSRPKQPVHRRHHHIALPANAINPGINNTVTRKMPRI